MQTPGSENELPKILLASTTSWPACAKLAIAFLRHRCHVEAICTKDHPFYYVSGIARIYPYRVSDSLQSLHRAIVASTPNIVVPCDDGVVQQLHELHHRHPSLRPLIERSLGAASGYDILSSRAATMTLAKELGIRIAETTAIATAADLAEWFSHRAAKGVLKLDGTYAGKGVQIVSSLAEANKAFAAMRKPPSGAVAWGRWFALGDAIAVWSWTNHQPPAFTMQTFVSGKPANTMMACLNGKVLALVTVEVLWTEGATGPASVVRLIENNEIRAAAERLADRLHLSGFHGLDFMLEHATGRAFLIELNPRCTQLGHLPIRDQGDLAGILAAALSTANLPRSSDQNLRPVFEKAIAFFPQALMSPAKCPYLEDAYIDVPWEEPELVRQLSQRDWRDRRWLARLYYALRPPSRTMVDTAKIIPFKNAVVPVSANVSIRRN